VVVQAAPRGLDPVLGADLLVDAAQVSLDSARRDLEPPRDVWGRHAAGQQREDLQLA
jgi:hypothetical protein